VPGHWEGDLLLGRGNSAIATLVERTSRLALLVGLPNGRSSEPVLATVTQEELDAVAAELNGRPRQTLNWRSPSEKFAEAVAMIA
jgi:IS30 family transposase